MVKKKDDNLNHPPLFVACFSKNNDLLPMWNYYLKSGKYEGYSLGFDFSLLKDDKFIMPLKILYDDIDKEQIVEYIIMESYQNTEESLDQRYSDLMTNVLPLRLVMKKNCFSYEKEIRLVIDYSEVNKNESDIYDIGEIQFRNKNGIIIPFFDVTFKEKRVFKSCNLAPTMPYDLSRTGLETMLKTNGYALEEVSIDKSTIPVRY